MDAAVGARRLSLPGRLRALLLGLTVTAVVCLAFAVVLGSQGPGAPWWLLLGFTGLIALSKTRNIRLYVGGNGMTIDCAEAVLMASFVFLDPSWVVLAAGVGSTIGYLSLPLDPVKKWFNVASNVVGAAAGAGALWLVGVDGARPDPLSLSGATGLIAMAGAASVVGELAATAAVATSRRSPFRAALLDGIGPRLLSFVLNIAIGVGVLAVWRTQPWLLVLLPPVLWLLIEGFAGRVRAGVERRMWQRLIAGTRTMSQLDVDAVLQAAIVESAQLFSADVVEIEWRGPAGAMVLTRGSADGTMWQGEPGLHRSESTVYPVTLSNGGGAPYGELRLCFRAPVRLPERERLGLETFGRTLAATMQNAYVHRQMHDIANTDALTSLANRNRLVAVGDSMLAGSSPVVLLLLGLDHFRQVNDTLGHAAGDEVLRAVAERLRGVEAAGETLARLGADEFALLVPAGPDQRAAAEHARRRATAMLAGLQVPVGVSGVRLAVEASIGYVAVEAGECGMAELLRRADGAMYRGKAGGQQVTEYDPELDAANVDRLALASEMRAALATDDQILIQLQPSVDLRTGEAKGAEALVRWRHPRRGLLPPVDFITHLEQTEVIAPLTRRIFELALDAYQSWAAVGIDLPIAVNLSARSLLDRDLPKDVARLLEDSGMPPDRLVLEITETAMMSELEVVDEVLSSLRNLGVKLSLDDFGTGFSSLTSVARVTVDEIKIDRRFVAAMNSSLQAKAIVGMTVELGRTLGLRVIAEGVETAEQREALIRFGCHGAQGYHFYRPMDPDVARTVLAAASLHGWHP